MVWRSVTDGSNRILLGEGFVPDLETLRTGRPRSPSYFEENPSECARHDDVLAWTLNVWTSHRARQLGYDVSTLAPETWVIGRPLRDDARLATWFEDLGKDYRIMLLRTTDCRHPTWGPYCWQHVYEKLNIRHRKGQYKHLLQTADAFLQDALRAYNHSHEQVRTLVHRAGHRWAFSDVDLRP